MNNSYIVEYGSGVSWESSANTMAGAKREATKFAAHGCSCIIVKGPNNEGAMKLKGEKRWRDYPQCPW